ncbi:MAG: 30S ribosomal protein S15 [Candidatus Omnitrophica bacterium]|nr:30S ribosomal protein S15 [Candidatus Omnitrophota bacterium]
MVVIKDKKKELIKNFAEHESDTGSCSVQAALLTERINNLTEHFKAHKKDFNSRVGLLRLVSQRKSLLEYLKREDSGKYRELIDKLKLKK